MDFHFQKIRKPMRIGEIKNSTKWFQKKFCQILDFRQTNTFQFLAAYLAKYIKIILQSCILVQSEIQTFNNV